MRKLFNIAVQRKQNFYSELLEPLFYDALNRNRGEQGYCPALHCRIPFLSGGLFEPIDGYDWEHNEFSIPNEVFSNESTKGKRDADGILDIFDRYNFTMSEDEPMEREVAIDPEMLGKVFENLLDITDRKSKGAFYTPPEILADPPFVTPTPAPLSPDAPPMTDPSAPATDAAETKPETNE